jgi:hypothetical protein
LKLSWPALVYVCQAINRTKTILGYIAGDKYLEQKELLSSTSTIPVEVVTARRSTGALINHRLAKIEM